MLFIIKFNVHHVVSCIRFESIGSLASRWVILLEKENHSYKFVLVCLYQFWESLSGKISTQLIQIPEVLMIIFRGLGDSFKNLVKVLLEIYQKQFCMNSFIILLVIIVLLIIKNIYYIYIIIILKTSLKTISVSRDCLHLLEMRSCKVLVNIFKGYLEA